MADTCTDFLLRACAVRIDGFKQDGGMNCLKQIFAKFEGKMNFNAEIQRKESRNHRNKFV